MKFLYNINMCISSIFTINLSPTNFNLLCNKFNSYFLTDIYFDTIPNDIYYNILFYFKLKNLSLFLDTHTIFIDFLDIKNAFISKIINNQDLNFIYSTFNNIKYYDISSPITIFGTQEDIQNLNAFLIKNYL